MQQLGAALSRSADDQYVLFGKLRILPLDGQGKGQGQIPHLVVLQLVPVALRQDGGRVKGDGIGHGEPGFDVL